MYLVKEAGDTYDGIAMVTASYSLNSVLREGHAQQIRSILYRTLAKAEANAPAAARGGFVGVGAALDALQVVGKVLAQAKQEILIIEVVSEFKTRV